MKISRKNYELFVLDYIEGNLTTFEREKFNRFLDNNQDIKLEIETFQLVSLPVDETIRFPDQGKLVKSGNRGTRKLLLWRSVAAAAVLALLLMVGKNLYERPENSGSIVIDASSQDQQLAPSAPDEEDVRNMPLQMITREEIRETEVDKDISGKSQTAALQPIESGKHSVTDALANESIGIDESLTAPIESDIMPIESPLALLPRFTARSVHPNIEYEETISSDLASFQSLEDSKGGDKLIKWFTEKSILPAFVLNLEKEDIKEALVPQYLVTD